MRLRLLPLAACSLTLLLPAGDALAGGDGRQARFKKARVTYKDKSTYRPAVSRAIELWNGAGTGVRLVPVRRGKRPLLTIRTRPTLEHGGRPVAGLGGGTDRRHKGRTRRLRGRVQLSAAALGDGAAATAEQINVAAHEIGHALGLEHSLGACDLMNQFGSAEGRGCESPSGSYRCGPQVEDAGALARLYRKTLAYPAGHGVCAFPQVPFEFVGPPAEAVAGDTGAVRVEARNTGTHPWDQYDLFVSYTDAAGSPIESPCSPGAQMRSGMNEPSVQPGATGSFDVLTCPPPGESATYHVRLFDDASQPGRPFPVGPVHTFTVRGQ